jgi:uncharacterized membrane protein
MSNSPLTSAAPASESDRTPTKRLEAFSDGVFAVAITLLVLDLHDPGRRDLAHGLGTLWPHYATYVVSFLTIGIIWMNHHTAFDRIERADRTLMVLNLLLLMFVTVIPFPTGLLADHLNGGNDEHVAAAVYSGSLLTMGVSFFCLYLWSSRRGLFGNWLRDEHIGYIVRRNLAGLVVYAAAVGIAFASAVASLVLCGLVALYYLHPGRPIAEEA